MNRPSSPWSTGTVTDRFDDHRPDIDDEDDEYEDVEDYDSYTDYGIHDDLGDLDDYDDRRWLWVASVAGIVLLIAVAGTLMILSGGDSGTTSATVSPSTSNAAPYPSAAPSPSTGRPSATALPPETITSVSPTATAAAPSTEPTEAAPPPAGPRTVTYQVTGTRQLLDLVTIIYTDAQGALQTDVNVALPWTKQVTLDPGVQLSSVTATSVAGQLNCSITDGAGETLATQSSNLMITNCTR